MTRKKFDINSLKPAEKLLHYQFILIQDICINVEYIKTVNELLKEGSKLPEKDHLKHIFHLSLKNTYNDFHKVIVKNQDHSFNSIIREVKKNTDDYPLVIGREDILKTISIKLKALNQVYKELKLYEIRNEYTAHLDRSLNSYSVDYTDIIDIKERLVDLNERMHDWLTDSIWSFMDGTLIGYLREIKIYEKVQKLIRSKFENQEELTKEEIREIYRGEH